MARSRETRTADGSGVTFGANLFQRAFPRPLEFQTQTRIGAYALASYIGYE